MSERLHQSFCYPTTQARTFPPSSAMVSCSRINCTLISAGNSPPISHIMGKTPAPIKSPDRKYRHLLINDCFVGSYFSVICDIISQNGIMDICNRPRDCLYQPMPHRKWVNPNSLTKRDSPFPHFTPGVVPLTSTLTKVGTIQVRPIYGWVQDVRLHKREH